MKQADVVIIGSGISALTSGALLSKKGKKVILLEQYTKPGGYMHSFKRFGETYDTGAHYMGALGEGQPFRVLLEYLNVFDSKIFAPLNKDAFDIFEFPEGRVYFPQGYNEVITELSVCFPNEKSAIEKYFRKIEAITQHFPTYRFTDASEANFPPEALDVSLKAIVESLTTNPRLQSVFYSYCNLHGVCPGDVAFGFHAIVTDSLIRGPYGLNGGGDALTQTFVKEIQANGGEILTKHKVISFKISDREIKKVVCANGEEFQAQWVISTIHPKATFRLIEDQSLFPPIFKERVKNIKESVGIFGLYAVCNQRPQTNPDANYYFFNSSDPEAMFAPTNPGDNPPLVFMSSPKRTWSSQEKNFPISMHSPAQFEWFTGHVDSQYGRRPKEYDDLKLKISQSMLGLLKKYLPQLDVKQFHTSTPLTHLHFNGSEEGSSYGIYHSIANTGPRAFGPRTKVLNLLLAGQSCLFPGLLGAATSALRTCGHIVGIKPLLAELKCASS